MEKIGLWLGKMSLTEQRVVVCHIGATPIELKQAFANSSFKLIESTLVNALKDKRLRTIIFSYAEPKVISSLLSKSLMGILDNGIQLIVIDNDKFARSATLLSPDSLASNFNISVEDARLLPIKIVNGNSEKYWFNRVLYHCHEHSQPISKVFNDPHVSLENATSLNQQQLHLIKRAFEDFKSITVGPLEKGMSSAEGPWRISAKSELRCVDFVVKIDTLTRSRKEIDAVRDMCVEQMAFPHYPPVMRDRCLASATRRAFVTCFVDRAVLFENYITVNSSKLAITSIFDGPLRLWRQNPRVQQIPFGEYAETEIFGKKIGDTDLISTYESAKLFDSSVLSPTQILSKLKSKGNIAISKVMSHGDLHLRNIFVRHHSPDIVLIDFSSCSELPAAMDPATLDISLGFDIPDNDPQKPYFDRETCIQIYAPPLFGRPIQIGKESPRAEAIEAVRSHAITLCKELEYQITIAASLLWRATKFKSESAYTCASNIAKVI